MEFYIKSYGDPNFDKTKLQSESKLAQLISQLEVVLFTNRGDVLGSPDFGCNIEEMIFEFNYNDSQIKRKIDEQVKAYCPLASEFNTKVSVDYERGVDRDAILINVVIDAEYQMTIVI
jgi:hypothetical protein